MSAEERERFRIAVGHFIKDLAERDMRAGLRVKRVHGTLGVYEMTWAPDGRATFEFGSGRGGGPHVIWRRIGTHTILRRP